MNRKEIELEIDQLKLQLSGNLMKDLEIKDQIHNLEMQLNGVKPECCSIECENCGS